MPGCWNLIFGSREAALTGRVVCVVGSPRPAFTSSSDACLGFLVAAHLAGCWSFPRHIARWALIQIGRAVDLARPAADGDDPDRIEDEIGI